MLLVIKVVARRYPTFIASKAPRGPDFYRLVSKRLRSAGNLPGRQR